MKTLILLIIVIGLLFGCAGSEKIRTVQDDNIFYSSSTPKIRIRINPNFKYDKETVHRDTGFSVGYGEKSSNRKITKFLFLDRVSGKRRGMEIVIVELLLPRWYFKPITCKMKNRLDSGQIKLQGKNYRYCTFIFVKNKKFVLVKRISRLVGGNSNAMIGIDYFEHVTGDWSNTNMLTAEQNKQLNEFVEDSKRDLQILEYKAPTSTPSKGKWGELSFTSHRG